MEKQLAEYRARKAKELASFKQTGWLGRFRGQSSVKLEESEQPSQEALDSTAFQEFHSTTGKEQKSESLSSTIFTRVTLLKFSLWLSLFGFFVAIQFGAVFVIFSFFYLIYATMSSGKRRREGELSAYSVFNPNCERIHGTLTAEQFEKEIKYGAGHT